ncbi:MAG TPA: GDSL-type esterase/lipase family protein [Stellaceae bacterium]|jgi:acyl-CoA thioesterase I|nr:GDSL-type esterase/lipase family protein [Stellaceae bacterium]
MRICFFGDSYVNGTGDPTGLGWVGRVSASARRRGHDLTTYNLGIRRDTSADIAARWQEEAARRLPTEFDCRLVFSFGVNDCTDENDAPRIAAERSLAHARAILGAAQARWPVLMLGPPPLPLGGAETRIPALSRALQALSAELGIPFLNLETPLSAMALWRIELAAGDGAHPGAAGYALIADLVEGWPAWRAWLP